MDTEHHDSPADASTLPFVPTSPLTKDSILAMSPEDYMNEEQLLFFKEELLRLKHEILSNANKTTESLRDTPVVPDPADRATIEEEHTLELRTRDRESKLLRKVEEALLRIEDKSYGWCAETGEPIGILRLLARPTTCLSIEAQQRRELRQRLYNA